MDGHGRRCVMMAIMLLALVDFVCGQSTSDFINIDCGKSRYHKSRNPNTGLWYVSDHDFIDSGELHKVSSKVHYPKGYPQELFDLRSFRRGRRNCYRVKPIKQGRKYLVRASFLYGNYDGMNQPPTFDLYMGINFWTSVLLNSESSYNHYEAMVIATSDTISICLIYKGKGAPFISVLELRPLPDELYPGLNSSNHYLVTLDRLSFTKHELRYPNDDYDRLWKGETFDFNTVTTTRHVDTPGKGFKPPLKVMQTAISLPNITYGTQNFKDWNATKQSVEYQSSRYYAAMHVAEIENLGHYEKRLFEISWEKTGDWTGKFTPRYLNTTTFVKHTPTTTSGLLLRFYRLRASTHPPIINAVEVFIVIDMQPETDTTDANAMFELKKLYKLQRNWQGDPCLPSDLSWEGMNCSFVNSDRNPRVIKLDLSSSRLEGKIENAFGKLARLRYLDLSNNKLTGAIPEILANLEHLEFLNLSYNRLSGSIPEKLLHRRNSGSLTLSIEGNPDLYPKRKNKNILIGALVGTVVLVAIVIAAVVIYFVLKRRKRKAREDSSTPTPPPPPPPPPPLLEGMRKFSYAELVAMTRNFERELGRGGFGVVYHGTILDNNKKQVAVKMFPTFTTEVQKQFQTEIEVLTRTHHKNLVACVGYCDEVHNLAVVFEYIEGGTLKEHISSRSVKALTWRERLSVALDAAKGLEYLHQSCTPPIIHRDVKSSNILLTKHLEAKIADFGISKIFQDSHATHAITKVAGTQGYLDPEYSISFELREKSDVYSFGVVLLELITGLPVFVGETHRIHIASWVNLRFTRMEEEVDQIMDQRISGDGGYVNVESVMKMVETALACTSHSSQHRPSMDNVVRVITNCLQLESTGH